ncbi:MAG TPA: hypothetical protein PKV06_16395, partial [bacterium]|nr:hypothetical protein [bacterium]
DVVLQPQAELNKLLTYSSMKEFQQQYLTTHGIIFEFSDVAIQKIAQRSQTEKRSFRAIAAELFKDYEYGLKLAGKTHFLVTPEVFDDPRKYLDELIKKSYSNK